MLMMWAPFSMAHDMASISVLRVALPNRTPATRRFACGATPMEMPFFVVPPAIVPQTWVPCRPLSNEGLASILRPNGSMTRNLFTRPERQG